MLTAGIVVLSVAVVARIGRFGFNPTDQGFVLAQVWRVLHGEIPQVDFLGPRPFGSAYLHLVDHLVPAPLMIGSSFVTMVQLTVATFALAAFLTGTSPLDWGPLRLGLVFAATLISLNMYPLMAWHTVDGVFLVALGWWLLDSGLRSDARWRRWLGLFCLGFAVIVKQSFLFAAPIGVLILLFHPAAPPKKGSRLPGDLLVLGAAPLLYFGMVTVAGGLESAIAQLTGGAQTWGEGLSRFWTADFAGRADPRTYVFPVLLGVLVLAVTWAARERLGEPGRWLRTVTGLCVVAVVVFVVADGGFEHAGSWPITLLWLFLAAALLDAVVRRRLPWRYLAIAALGWMASLSWGYPLPGLLTGIFALGVLEAVAPPRPPRLAGGVLGAIAFVLAGLMLMSAHDKAPYADRPQGELTKDLGSVAPSLRGVRTTPNVYRYVSQIRGCLDRYPASRVAVLPDNPFVAPVFGVRDPFPLDWPIPLELTGDSPERMVEAAERLAAEGNYLVLFQTVRAASLAAGAPVPEAVAPDAPTIAMSGIEERIKGKLTGARVACGGFAGFWAPPR
ncbi:hypothetical protein GCM10027598_22660 [Amycolatopsis oliviviridis]|uniref:Glycosyltransferase RgtA/B/C/D-like domain-containing protein n=1 Tax=Amycolatopsis oliviviridis TaxID=1471590 RepID=A0ABQ3LHG6_9PSEU|nr:hypothetical protein [Amycolatopsis oliviviridis]GHH15601.1 hypothetical protein GCM10017790_30300 [Amycolatopsis oliviviridis]